MIVSGMKPISVLTIACTVLILLNCACAHNGESSSEAPVIKESISSDADDQAPPESEQAFYLRDLDSASSSFGMQNIFETEKAVYCVTDRALPDGSMTSFMYFSDKEAHEWLPLCGRPDCMHNSESCSAMLEGNVNMKIWLYGSHIYYMLSSSQPVLWRMKLDGSGHEKLLAFKLPEDTEFSQYMWNWYFHGKYAIAELISVNGGDREDERDIRRYMIGN